MRPVWSVASGVSTPRKAKSERKRPRPGCHESAYSRSVRSDQLVTRISSTAVPPTARSRGIKDPQPYRTYRRRAQVTAAAPFGLRGDGSKSGAEPGLRGRDKKRRKKRKRREHPAGPGV